MQENSLQIPPVQDSRVNGQTDSGSQYSGCDQMHKPDKIIPILFRQSPALVQDSAAVKNAEMGMTNVQNNVIPIAAARVIAGQQRVERLGQAKFAYPMLECF